MSKHSDSGIELKIDLIIMGTLLVLVFIASGCENNEYNGGIHKGCGGTYIFQQAIGHKYSTSYLFKCDKCNETLEVADYSIKGEKIHYSEE